MTFGTPAPTGLVSPEVRIKLQGSAGLSHLPREVLVYTGTPARQLLKTLGVPVESCGLWWNGEPVPSDFPIPGEGTLEIVQTFSGG